MALLRLLCFPSATQHASPKSLNPTSLQPTTTDFHSISLSSSSSLSHHSHRLQIKTRRPGKFFVHVSSTAEAQSTATETLEVESPSTLEQIPVEEDASRTRIIAHNVPFDATADDLRPLFEKYGTVLNIEFSMHNQSRNRGLAFITMSSHEEAVAAIPNLQSYDLKERILRLDWANPRKKKNNPPRKKILPIHNLYVTNLSFKARAKDLRDLFNGDKENVVSAEVIFDENRRAKGFGFVSYNTEEEAEEAVNAFQGKEILGRAIRVARSKTFARLAAIDAGSSAVESNTSSPEPEEVAEEV